ncbi:MAG TPA: GRAM domain-containing protein [Paenisporosarcina sp.]|nr:GRAM domain-containing protein [Paenisporosarcina sp.]
MTTQEANQEQFNVAANLFRGMESVAGKMKITDKEIIFTPHKINAQRNPISININDIKEVGKCNTFYIVPNGLAIVVKSDEEYKFVVNKRQKIITHLNEQLVE